MEARDPESGKAHLAGISGMPAVQAAGWILRMLAVRDRRPDPD